MPNWLTPVAEISDAQLVRAFQAGDAEAFAVLYRRHEAVVARICRTRLRDADAAAEAVQETFARVLAALPNVSDGPHFDRYLKRAAANVCVDHYRRRGSAPQTITLDDAGCANTSVEDSLQLSCERSMAVQAVLAGVGEQDARLLARHHLADQSVHQMAIDLGSTPGSIKVRLHRARRRARSYADTHGWRGLIPVGWWHRLSATPDLRLLVCEVGLTIVAPVAVALIALQPVSGAAAASPPVPPSDIATVAAAEREVPRPATATVPQARGGRDSVWSPRAARTTRLERDRGVSRTDTPPRGKRALIAAEPVDVPVARRQVRTAPPAGQTFQYDYGIETTTTGKPTKTGVSVDNEPESEPIHKQVCSTAERSPAITYCDRGQ